MAMSALLIVLNFAALQVYKTPLAASEAGTVVGGVAASFVFIFALTVSNQGLTKAWIEFSNLRTSENLLFMEFLFA